MISVKMYSFLQFEVALISKKKKRKKFNNLSSDTIEVQTFSKHYCCHFISINSDELLFCKVDQTLVVLLGFVRLRIDQTGVYLTSGFQRLQGNLKSYTKILASYDIVLVQKTVHV